MMMLRNLLILMAVGLVLFSCSKDDEMQTDVVINAQDVTITLDENPSAGLEIGEITASVDGGAEISYFLTTESDPGAFTLKPKTGAIVVVNAALFDYEARTSISGTVRLVSGNAAKDITVTINLQDVDDDEQPEIVITANDWTHDLDENPESGWILGAINPSVNEGTLTYELIDESAPGAFIVRGDTAAIIIADATLWDYEVNPVITGTVRFAAGDVTKDVTVTINLQDVDESRLVDSAIGYYSFDDGLRNDNADYAYATVGDSLKPVVKGSAFVNQSWRDRFGNNLSVMSVANGANGMQIPTWNRADLGTEHGDEFTIAFWVQFNNLTAERTVPLWELNCGFTPAIALFFDNKSSARKDQLYIRQQEPGGQGASGAVKVLDTDKIVRVEQGVFHTQVSEWIYIAMSYDWASASIKMVIKGEGDNSAVDYSYSWTDDGDVIYPPFARSDDDRVMTVGSRECSTTGTHIASYDDFMIFDYALTQQEMLDLREELNEN